MNIHRGPSTFTRFQTGLPFQFKLSTFELGFSQGPDGSRNYYTRNAMILQQVRQAGSAVRVTGEKMRLRCLPLTGWTRDYRRRQVLFVLPSEALGDCVGVVLFLRAFCLRFPDAAVTVANTGGATDLFGREPGLRVLPLIISDKELERHDLIIDLGEIDGWDAVVTQPVDVEGALLKRFGLEPLTVSTRPIVTSSPKIAIFPLASSPLRTFPPRVAASLAEALARRGEVTVMLNAYQGVKDAYERELRPLLPSGVKVMPGFRTTWGLLDFFAQQDFVALTDSGPAHLSKLFGTPGMAVYTSASGEVLQGRHHNLGCWQVTYSGPHCAAPCGLAKLRATADDRAGCMGSLNLPLDALPKLPAEMQPDLARRLILEEPVPCVAALLQASDELACATVERLEQAMQPAGGLPAVAFPSVP